MNAEFLQFIKPYLLATQYVVSKRELNLEEILLYCNSPSEVPASGRKNLYKVFSDLFKTYKVDAPKSIYDVTPAMLNNYAAVYSKYVLRRPVNSFEDVIEWDNIIHDLYDQQRGFSWQMYIRMLQLNMYGEDTIEICTFICNILALALNGQPLIVTPSKYKQLVKYYRDEQWYAIDDLVTVYIRYREFLHREYAFVYYLYILTVQYGYVEDSQQIGQSVFALTIGEHTYKAKTISGSPDWSLTVYSNNKSMLGTASYNQASTRLSVHGSFTPEKIAIDWFNAEAFGYRAVPCDMERAAEVIAQVRKCGLPGALIVQHLQGRCFLKQDQMTVCIYKTHWSTIIHIRELNKLIGSIELGNGLCYASNDDVVAALESLVIKDNNNNNVSLVDAFEQHLTAKLGAAPNTRAIVEEVVNVLNSYGVLGLDSVQQSLVQHKD